MKFKKAKLIYILFQLVINRCNDKQSHKLINQICLEHKGIFLSFVLYVILYLHHILQNFNNTIHWLYLQCVGMGIMMLRVDVLLSKDDKVPKQLSEALQNELDKRISALYNGAIVRVRISSSKSVEISGCNKDDRENVLKMIENVFNSDEWLPE